MKNIIALILSTLIICSFSACNTREASIENTSTTKTAQVTEVKESEAVPAISFSIPEETMDSILSWFDEKFYAQFMSEGEIFEVSVGIADEECGKLVLFVNEMNIEQSQAIIEETFGVSFDENQNIYNDAENGVVYIINEADDGVIIRYDFFGGDYADMMISRNLFEDTEKILPDVTPISEKLLTVNNDSCYFNFSYEYSESEFDDIWSEYQNELKQLGEYDYIDEGDFWLSEILLDDNIIIESHADGNWDRFNVCLYESREEYYEDDNDNDDEDLEDIDFSEFEDESINNEPLYDTESKFGQMQGNGMEYMLKGIPDEYFEFFQENIAEIKLDAPPEDDEYVFYSFLIRDMTIDDFSQLAYDNLDIDFDEENEAEFEYGYVGYEQFEADEYERELYNSDEFVWYQMIINKSKLTDIKSLESFVEDADIPMPVVDSPVFASGVRCKMPQNTIRVVVGYVLTDEEKKIVETDYIDTLETDYEIVENYNLLSSVYMGNSKMLSVVDGAYLHGISDITLVVEAVPLSIRDNEFYKAVREYTLDDMLTPTGKRILSFFEDTDNVSYEITYSPENYCMTVHCEDFGDHEQVYDEATDILSVEDINDNGFWIETEECIISMHTSDQYTRADVRHFTDSEINFGKKLFEDFPQDMFPYPPEDIEVQNTEYTIIINTFGNNGTGLAIQYHYDDMSVLDDVRNHFLANFTPSEFYEWSSIDITYKGIEYFIEIYDVGDQFTVMVQYMP